MIFEPHPSREALRAYSCGLAVDRKLGEVEGHLFICQICQDKLVLASQDEQRVKSPDNVQRRANRLRSIHITEDGPIFAAMHKEVAGKWVALHWGRQLSGRRICGSVDEANEYLTESFQQMFPDHRCSEWCSDPNTSNHIKREPTK
jgi:hypothetical protein